MSANNKNNILLYYVQSEDKAMWFNLEIGY